MSCNGWVHNIPGMGRIDVRFLDPYMFIEDMDPADARLVIACWDKLSDMWADDTRNIDMSVAIWNTLRGIKTRYDLPRGAMEPPGLFSLRS